MRRIRRERRNAIIAAEYEGGSTVPELAEKHDLTDRHVKRVLRGAGLVVSARRGRKPIKVDADEGLIRMLWRNKTSMRAMAQELDLDRSVLRRHLVELGLKEA